ncbi:guanylate kinase [Enterococcus sp. AZ194]|uniref:guanylate kinase n=1 Tax=Enterococcus sp. AZ194 TaxID=2774629 RepID=UPI003F22C269
MTTLCYLFIGPSGSGKTTLANALFNKSQKVISYTTRSIRIGERDKRDYYFVSENQFKQMIKENKFAEYDSYGHHYYGVTKETLEEKMRVGDCYDVLTSAGFWRLRNLYGERMIPVFLTISKKTMTERLRLRGESSEEMAKRRELFEKDLKEKDDLLAIPEAIFLDAEQSVEALTKEFQTIITQRNARLKK